MTPHKKGSEVLKFEFQDVSAASVSCLPVESWSNCLFIRLLTFKFLIRALACYRLSLQIYEDDVTQSAVSAASHVEVHSGELIILSLTWNIRVEDVVLNENS